jgi:4-alpha-glucanotransferase
VSAIDELANAYGIESEFVDAHGKTQATSTETKLSLLQALGADVADDGAAQSALSALEDEAWQRIVPPVLVASEDPPIVPLNLPVDTTSIGWQLYLEDGTQRSGSAASTDLELLGNQTIDNGDIARRGLVLPTGIPHGYHELRIDGFDERMTLISAPRACVLPDDLVRRNGWGVAVQLYALRSESNWGIGDFDDLQRLTELVAANGADVIGLNPLHAMFLDDPEHASPYSPASRLLLNVLNINVTSVPGFTQTATAQELFGSATFQARLAACRNSTHVRYADVAALKLSILRLVYEGDDSGAASPKFEAFIAKGADSLRNGCLFQVLRRYFGSRDLKMADWRAWPVEYQKPQSSTVRAFENEHADELRFQCWLQWVADEQLAGAAAAGAAAGMRIGLYRDLAVGSDPSGVEGWSNARAVVQSASVGAPPDILNTKGQNWGLPPFHPVGLRNEAYRSFVELVRTNMRHAGAIRIDHVMALQHLYLIPANAEPADGAYVRYPIDDLVGILALESVRNNCLVIGEDLGTVPAGFRERMTAANILSYRVLFFERSDDQTFLPPEAYPQEALAVIASHDLATLRAWLDASDIDLRLEIGSIDREQAAEQREQRSSDREALLDALVREKLISSVQRNDVDAIVVAAHAYLARTPAVLVMAQLDDITGERAPVNLPATTDQYPNWRRRISVTLEDLAAWQDFVHISEAFTAAGRTNG